MNSELEKLHAYPFEKLEKLLNGIEVITEEPLISLAIGEPKHQTPKFIPTLTPPITNNNDKKSK